MASRPTSFFSTQRVESYTDAVFAIAATLLVLDLTTTAIGEVSSDDEMWVQALLSRRGRRAARIRPSEPAE